MALLARKALLESINPFSQIKRFRGKINLKKPKPPHYERATYIELTKPYFISPKKGKTLAELCKKSVQRIRNSDIENPFQKIIAGELLNRFQKSRLVVFYHMNSMTGDEQFKAYALFHKEKMFLKNYGKKTMQLAVEGTPYQTILQFYVSRNMTLFSPEPELKKVLKIVKKFPQLTLLAAIYDGKLISKDEFMEYSLIPNLQAAQSNFVQTLNTAASNLVSHLNSHQNTLVSHLGEREKQLKEET